MGLPEMGVPMQLTTNEQIAADIVRNLSEALARLCEVNISQCSSEGYGISTSLEKKLQKWIKKL